jgi:hypothetical protein
MKTTNYLNEIKVPDDLESKLETLIDRLDREEKQSKKKAKQIRLWLGSLAASFAILISVGLFINHSVSMFSSDFQNLTIEEKTACMEAQKALLLVSENFNKGMAQITMVSNEMDKTNKTLNKTIKR